MEIIKRTFVSEIRAEQEGGKTYLQGRAASYGVMSHDLGGYREILVEGCFDSALAAPDADIVHNINHSADKVLGRSTSGTLVLSTSRRGLNYKTLLPQTGYSRDLVELVKRGDIRESSFAFTVDPEEDKKNWSDVEDPDDQTQRCALRTITKIVKLYDVSTVTNAAYPETAAAISDRSLPASMPIELRNRILSRAADDDDDACSCDCVACLDDDCDSCDPETCQDPENCRCMRSATGASDSPTKKIDGEDLPQSAFLIHGDESDSSTWKLPVRFGSLAKSEKHVRLAIDLFSTLKDVSDDEKARAWKELEALAAKYGIDIDTEDDSRARARRLELATIE